MQMSLEVEVDDLGGSGNTQTRASCILHLKECQKKKDCYAETSLEHMRLSIRPDFLNGTKAVKRLTRLNLQ